MKGTYREVMTIDEFYQALFQDKTFFTEHGVTHIRSASLYFTPCDSSGREVLVLDAAGGVVEGYESGGCYRSAAEKYEEAKLEPKVLRTTTKKGGGRRGGGGRRCKPG
ncbi:hypothetical protein [Sinorhizobium fredii]|uniref:hypothetical protein n=1 Tax=Rhizobium fredii TaxID=380 RepID=UPI0005691C51|nr:hypothetical protein [Sinorhizobium fredii]AWI58444.1 hypothetical protein AB395_00002793 [Sinorhizobium fredii CCBAU 45436]